LYIYKYFCTFAPENEPKRCIIVAIKGIHKSELVRNSARLLTANVVAQAIGLLVYPVLTRLYAPEDFGLLNLFMSIGGIGVLLATMAYHDAIVLPKEESRARALMQVCGLCVAAVMVLFALTIPLAKPIAALFETPDLAQWWWLMPLYIGGMGLWNAVSNLFIRTKSFRRISVYQIAQSVLNAGGKAGLGALGWIPGGLIMPTIFSPVLAIGISLLNGGKRLVKDLFRWDGQAVREAAKEYRNFPFYSCPRMLISYLSNNLPFLLLTPVFGLTQTGYFGMAMTLAYRPIQMVVQSVYQVLYQRTTQLVNEGQRILPLLRRFVLRAVLVIAPVWVVLYGILPWLTAWLLGDEWRVCGEYIRLLLPWLMMVVLTITINYLPDIFGRQRTMMWIEILYLVLRVSALLAGIYMQSVQWAIGLYAASGTLILTGELIWFLVLAYRHDRKL
jgi:O-antigen/teichoic acid export membrane protein